MQLHPSRMQPFVKLIWINTINISQNYVSFDIIFCYLLMAYKWFDYWCINIDFVCPFAVSLFDCHYSISAGKIQIGSRERVRDGRDGRDGREVVVYFVNRFRWDLFCHSERSMNRCAVPFALAERKIGIDLLPNATETCTDIDPHQICNFVFQLLLKLGKLSQSAQNLCWIAAFIFCLCCSLHVRRSDIPFINPFALYLRCIELRNHKSLSLFLASNASSNFLFVAIDVFPSFFS